MSTSGLVAQAVSWTLCATALGISYRNYSHYIDAKRDPDSAKRYLQMALYARSDAGIGEDEFKKIESSHYRPYQKRFRIAIFVGLSSGLAGLVQLLAYP